MVNRIGSTHISIFALVMAVFGIALGEHRHRQISSVEQVTTHLLVAELSAQQFAMQGLVTDAKESGDTSPIAVYLASIRRDGLPAHRELKQRLQDVYGRNERILAIFSVATSTNKSPELSRAADSYRRFAIAWNDRWASSFEYFMAGGSFPGNDPKFPAEVPILLKASQSL